jgi:hypothetical protein
MRHADSLDPPRCRPRLLQLCAYHHAIGPTLGVVIARNERGGRSISAADFNRATVYNSREFVAHHPDGLADATLRYALHDDMRTQRWILPIVWGATLSAADQEARTFADQPNQP